MSSSREAATYSSPRRRWVVAGLLAAWLLVSIVGAGKLWVRQDTMMRWNGVVSLSMWMTSSGGWSLNKSERPCGDSDPEAFIELQSKGDSEKLLQQLGNYLDHSTWKVERGPSPEPLIAQSWDPRVRLIVESDEASGVTASIELDERC